MTTSLLPVVLRGGVVVENPLHTLLGLLKGPWRIDVSDPERLESFGEPDLRLANRGGARISAAEIAAILERRPAIEQALRAIAPDASLAATAGTAATAATAGTAAMAGTAATAGTPDSVPWLPLGHLLDAFAGIRGVGFAKMTKALHPKRPALIPMLDSIVQRYLHEDDLGAQAPFGPRALGLIRGYKRDLDGNRSALQAVQQDLAGHGYQITEVRILDLLILSA